MLDHGSATDLAPEEAIRHLAPDELEAYAGGRLASTRLNDCRTHLDSCEACRAELEDLRLFKSEMSAFPRVEAKGREKRKRRAGAAFAAAASVAAILLAVGSAVLWWRHESSRAGRTSAVTVAAAGAKVGASANSAPAISVAQSPAAPAAQPAPTANSTHARDPELADEHVGQAPARAPTSPVVVPANTGFALLGPDGDISDPRPEFSWQPLAGAVRYRVVVVDAGLRPVQRSPLLRKTAWRPRRALRRGRTYLWQVTATLRGGSKVVASAPGKLTER